MHCNLTLILHVSIFLKCTFKHICMHVCVCVCICYTSIAVQCSTLELNDKRRENDIKANYLHVVDVNTHTYGLMHLAFMWMCYFSSLSGFSFSFVILWHQTVLTCACLHKYKHALYIYFLIMSSFGKPQFYCTWFSKCLCMCIVLCRSYCSCTTVFSRD